MTSPNTLSERQSIGASLQASKWQKIPVLLDVDEMKTLIEVLSPFWMIQTSGIFLLNEEFVVIEKFLDLYAQYIQDLKIGKFYSSSLLRAYFSSVWTNTLKALYKVKMKPESYVIGVELPVVQLQAHRFTYSSADQKIRSMALGFDSIEWGILFSFPSLFQDQNFQVHAINNKSQFSNFQLFKHLQQWMRSNTSVTSFIVQGEVVNVPIRLGKMCKSWINTHPQLIAKGLQVRV